MAIVYPKKKQRSETRLQRYAGFRFLPRCSRTERLLFWGGTSNWSPIFQWMIYQISLSKGMRIKNGEKYLEKESHHSDRGVD